MANQPIKLLVGLGNPGPEYERTPHNVGFWLIDELARRYKGQLKPESKFHGDACKINIAGHDCWLLKPMTFMNHSGQSVTALANYFKIGPSQVLVAHDELDFPSGSVRLKYGGGHGGHNGLRDIMPSLGKDFYRLRIGVGHPGDRHKVTDYLLGRASKEVLEGAMQSIYEALDVIELLIKGEIDKAMQVLHSDSQE